MLLQKRLIHFFYLFIFLLFLQNEADAQLQAAFTTDYPGGCSPLAVHFSNTTSGASSSATFLWDFGNGNASTLKNPGAIFRDESSYTVTLTVTDNNQTSTATHTITVYQKPTVDFSVSAPKGCVPLSDEFTGIASSAKGSISNYFWDFGDGFTSSSADSGISHVYNNASQPPISLTVTDNHGCQSTVVKNNIVKVLPELVSAFVVDKPVLCKITDAATFTNKSSGPGTLSYLWNFGDNTTSTAMQPSHVFSKVGIYNISLQVKSSEGCTVTGTADKPINAAGFKSEITIPHPVCENNTSWLYNTSMPAPDSSIWDFNNGVKVATTGYDSIVSASAHVGNFTLKLINTFGACKDTITKVINVKKSPVVNGFISDINTPCGSPATVNFKDTTNGAVKWQWNSTGFSNLNSTDQATSYTFAYDDNYYVSLKVSNADGCYTIAGKYLDINKPLVTLSTPQDRYGNGVTSCGRLNVQLVATSSITIKTYQWDFGDSSASSPEAAPAHLYSKEGNYYVHLVYTLTNGCSGESDLYYPIVIRDKVKANFTAGDTDVCGNTPFTITNLTPVKDYYNYYWNFGDGQDYTTYWNSGGTSIVHQYQAKGTYDITLVATDGTCFDTLVKKNLVKISPPFPKISNYTNTCEGTRGEVTFNQASTEVVSGVWDFGDGTTAPYLPQAQIKHTYTKTGFYKVVLSTTNGACTVGDSTFITVLLKQHPVLTGDKTTLCSTDDYLTLTYSNLETNPASEYNNGYGPGSWYHQDGSYAIGAASPGDLDINTIKVVVSNFTPGEGLYSMVTSYYFGCVDTTNLIPLTIKGPIAGYQQVIPDACTSNNTVTLEDTSQTRFGAAIVSWEWNFGDGQTQTYHQAGNITHTYSWPGTYQVYLTVTDANGCHSFTPGQGLVDASKNSLKASFTPSITTISPGSSVSFTNTSQTTDIDNTVYKWLFGDGTQSLSNDAEKTFSVPGSYIVKLVAQNKLKRCTDTASCLILVKYVNAAFSFNSSNISNSKCPPVVVSFSNTSSNVSKISWDFGDGSSAINVFNPTHVYTKAGHYIINVTTYSDNGSSYVTKDSVTIGEPSVELNSNIKHSCTAQSVTFNALAKNVASYLWDFGDGNIYSSTDTFAVHNYPTAGMFEPHVIVTDSNGCNTTVDKGDTIIIDSLNVALPNIPSSICTPKEVFFNPDVISISGNELPQSLIYHWDFGTGNSDDSSNQKATSFNYNQPGNYQVTLKVQSQFGCTQQVSKSIVASQGLGGFITGPTELCQNGSAQFKGNTQLPGQPAWLWIFDDGTTVQQQNTPSKKYDKPGTFSVKLVVDNGGCSDTVVQNIEVYPEPVAAITPQEINLCEGNKITLSASGGNSYQWYPAAELNNTASASVEASPLSSTNYVVDVTDAHGCSVKDSASIAVIHRFAMVAENGEKICAGKSVMLQVSGADTYHWINNTNGLSNTSAANPIATPDSTSTYSVVGIDPYKCFTDTANITITVLPLPVIDAGRGDDILAGTSYQLQSTSSDDVIKWNWSPSEYLSCIDCQSPLATPSKSEIYTLTATNSDGCSSSDTVSVNIYYKETRVFIPNAFTPNNDGKNDILKPTTYGNVTHYSFVVYNRFGQKVFESTDLSRGWDGTFHGVNAPADIYVWVCSYQFDGGNVETKKGSVMLMR